MTPSASPSVRHLPLSKGENDMEFYFVLPLNKGEVSRRYVGTEGVVCEKTSTP